MSRRTKAVIILFLAPVLGVLAVLVWWWLYVRFRKQPVRTSRTVTVAPPAPAKRSVRRAPDDLKRIKGIGPRISGVLQAADVGSFARLAAAEVAELERVIGEAGIRSGYTGTWPEQAGLAAAGDWKALEALQGQL